MVAVKKKTRKGTQMVKKKKQSSGRVAQLVSQSDETQRVARHVQMIMDPCNAVIGSTAYRGADGFVTRFRNSASLALSPGTNTLLYIYYPGDNSLQTLSGAFTDVTSFTSTADGPGKAFLTVNSDCCRTVGACTTLVYTGTALDRAGIIYSGVVPLSTLQNAKSLNSIATNLQCVERVPDTPYDLKWSPSPVDEEYTRNTAAAIQTGDRNAIVFVITGLNPANSSGSFNMINTHICEWKPESGLGLSTPTPSTADVPGGLEKVRTILSKMGKWWAGAAHTAYAAAQSPIGQAVLKSAALLL